MRRVIAWLGELNKAGRLGVEKVAKGSYSSQRNLFEKETEPEWVEVNVKGVRVENIRDFGGPWLCLELVRQLHLDQFYLDCANLPPVTREVEVTHGYGEKRYTEKVLTTLVGVPDILTCDWFNPEGSKANTAKKDYEPIPLNAVVVKKWGNKVPPLEKQVVFVTNIDVKDPFITFEKGDGAK